MITKSVTCISRRLVTIVLYLKNSVGVIIHLSLRRMRAQHNLWSFLTPCPVGSNAPLIPNRQPNRSLPRLRSRRILRRLCCPEIEEQAYCGPALLIDDTVVLLELEETRLVGTDLWGYGEFTLAGSIIVVPCCPRYCAPKAVRSQD